eukprot:1338631-Amorphochlora_amoeboformis.AAC.1
MTRTGRIIIAGSRVRMTKKVTHALMLFSVLPPPAILKDYFSSGESRGSGADSGQWQRGKEVERPSAKREMFVSATNAWLTNQSILGITTRTSSHYVPKALREKQQNGRKVRHGREAANRSERSREGQGSRMKGRQPRDKDTREGRGRGGRGSKGRARGERGRRRRKAKVSMEDLDAEER